MLGERIGIKLISFVITIFLARILSPLEFGVVALVSSFTDILYIFIKGGLGEALIRKQDVDEKYFSTAFVFNLAVSVICYVLIFISAGFIADFFDNQSLTLIIRVVAINLIISSFSFVQLARLTRQMNFRFQTLSSWTGLVIGGVTGVTCAFLGYGVWALVIQNLVSAFITTALLLFLIRWRISLYFSITRFKELWTFGYKLLTSALINSIMSNIYTLVIGRYQSAVQVGLFNRANALRDLYLNNVVHTVQRVSYPVLASIGHDNNQLKSTYRTVLQFVMFATLPVMILGGLAADDLFYSLYGQKWMAAVPYFKLVCILGALYPLHSINLNILKVKSRSDLFLQLEVIKSVLVLIVLWFTREYSVSIIIIGQIGVSVIALFMNSYYSGDLIQYSILQQAKDLGSVFGISIFSGTFLYFFRYFAPLENSYVSLLVSISIYSALFFGLSYILKQAPMLYLINKVKLTLTKS